jgi:galactokinase
MKGTFKASAPGRMDVMGGIADYSGSLVLQKAIAQQTFIELTLREDYRFSITSSLSNDEVLKAHGDYRAYLNHGRIDYDFARQTFKQNSAEGWLAYVLGCALVLQKEKGIDFRGADINLRSEVPNGKGVASSASVEVATMRALIKAFNLQLTGTELPILAQRVENQIVGAPCGLMDQLASNFGKPGTLLPIVCQPDLLQNEIAIPSDVSFVGIDSGIRHQVAGASYSDVRCAAFMGHSIVMQKLGASKDDIIRAKTNTSILPHKGYLTNIAVEEFVRQFQQSLPERMSGEEFLNQHGDTIDTVTTIDRSKSYSIRNCTSHPVYEHHRVTQFQDYLQKLNEGKVVDRNTAFKQMGQLMQEAHASYSRCGLGTERTDEILSLALTKEGILGGRITGGGNGGTVCLLAIGEVGKKSATELHKLLCTRYQENLGLFL